MRAAADDRVNRRPVWEALSEIFLDTDVSLSRDWRVSILADSPYSVDEIESILIDEVYPICKYNLLSVAGEWEGFDQARLEERILRRSGSRLPRLTWLNTGHLTIARSSEWRETRAAVVAARKYREGRVT